MFFMLKYYYKHLEFILKKKGTVIFKDVSIILTLVFSSHIAPKYLAVKVS